MKKRGVAHDCVGSHEEPLQIQLLNMKRNNDTIQIETCICECHEHIQTNLTGTKMSSELMDSLCTKPRQTFLSAKVTCYDQFGNPDT